MWCTCTESDARGKKKCNLQNCYLLETIGEEWVCCHCLTIQNRDAQLLTKCGAPHKKQKCNPRGRCKQVLSCAESVAVWMDVPFVFQTSEKKRWGTVRDENLSARTILGGKPRFPCVLFAALLWPGRQSFILYHFLLSSSKITDVNQAKRTVRYGHWWSLKLTACHVLGLCQCAFELEEIDSLASWGG